MNDASPSAFRAGHNSAGTKVFAILATLLLTAYASSEAATLPYTDDFSGTGGNTAFPVEGPDADWNVTGGVGGVYRFSTSSTVVGPSTATIPITNAAATSFTLETTFRVSSTGSVNANGATLGMGLFGSSATLLSTGGNSFYLADWQVAHDSSSGLLRILSLGDSAGFTNATAIVDDNTSTSTLAIQLNTTYTLRLVGTYSGSTLSMTLGVWNAAGTTQIGSSATATDTSPLLGTNFGYRNRIGIGGGTFTADFDNFSIVPEPNSLGLLLFASSLALFKRRRVSGN